MSQDSETQSNNFSQPFYINVLLKNKDAVVANKVEKKLGHSFFGRAASFAANKLITDEKIIEKLSTTLIEKITLAISEMGITATLEKKFQKQSFVVIRVELVEVDKLKLIQVAKGEEFFQHFLNLLTSIEGMGISDTVLPSVEFKIQNLVHKGMMNKFSEILPVKMNQAGLEVDVIIHDTTTQSEFFYSILDSLV